MDEEQRAAGELLDRIRNALDLACEAQVISRDIAVCIAVTLLGEQLAAIEDERTRAVMLKAILTNLPFAVDHARGTSTVFEETARAADKRQ